MMPTGSEPLLRERARLPISRQGAIAASRSALAHIYIEPATWSNGSSTRSSTVAGSQRATTSWRRTTSLSFSLRRSGYGCALMSPRPSYFGAAHPQIYIFVIPRRRRRKRRLDGSLALLRAVRRYDRISGRDLLG